MDKTYEDGLTEGRLAAVEHMQSSQNIRLDHHGARLTALERALWLIVGAVGALQFFPLIADLIKKATGLG